MLLCDRCGASKPESEFRWRTPGVSRHTDCNFCHSRRECERVAAKRALRRDRKILRSCRAISKADDVRDVVRLARLLMDRFGGARRLAQQVSEVIELAKPGSMVVGNVMLAVMKIQLVAASASRDAELPATLESKREALAREFTDFLLEQVYERPDELAELLRAAGWRVEPPESSQQTAA